jgi:D-alanyl-D-alanine carboxypeptidase
MRAQLEPRSPAARDATVRFECIVEELVTTLGNLSVLAAIEVHGRGRWYFTAGHADLARTTAAATKHLYQIASQSKTVVALALVLLERAGKVELDDLVSKYLDLPIDRRITLRHLIMNTCGLGETVFAMPPARRDPRITYTPRDLIALALPQGQLFEPGRCFDYCNTGWVIAAMVIEKVCRKPYGEVIRESILEPLKLRDSFFGGTAPGDRMLHGYLGSPATDGPVDTAEHLSWAWGAGDGVSSVDDMLTLFTSFCRTDSPIGISLRDLSSTVAHPPSVPYHPGSLGAVYGLGVERRAWAGSEVWGHPGSTNSYLSGTWVDPGFGVTVTTCVTRVAKLPASPELELSYPRAQLFAMALNTAYALARDGEAAHV